MFVRTHLTVYEHPQAHSGKNGKSLLLTVYRENSPSAQPAFQAKINSRVLQFTSQETRGGSPLPHRLFCSPVNILLICCVVRLRGKHTKLIVTLIP